MSIEAFHSFAAIENEVIIWGRARQIIQNSNSRAQASKALEEVDELLDHTSAIKAYRDMTAVNIDPDHDLIIQDRKEELFEKIKDDIGDVLVTLIMVAEIEGLTLTECLAAAYEDIKDRKGYLGADGKFHKE